MSHAVKTSPKQSNVATLDNRGPARQWIVVFVLTALLGSEVALLSRQAALASTRKQNAEFADQVEKKNAIRLLAAHVRHSSTGMECRLDADSVFMVGSGFRKVDQVLFSRLRVRVDHPRVAATDTDISGRRTPLSVRLRGPVDTMDTPGQCIIYSALTAPEAVTEETWSAIDRLLAALVALGATVEQWRPPDDPSAFDED